MHLLDGNPVYSAGDLVGFLACEHLTDLERAALAGRTTRPVRNDPEIELIRRRGFEHEARYKAQLEAEGRQVTTIQPDTSANEPDGLPMSHADQFREQVRLTHEAIVRGDEVIYQAALFDGRWRGHADFLLRVPGRSELGSYHYEIADTKLARSVKAGALLQLCTYVDLLEKIQGRRPEYVSVALGGSQRPIERHRVADYYAYYRSIKDRFDATVRSTFRPVDFPPSASQPDPVDHCDVCRWIVVCKGWWRSNDSLALVAGISRGQRTALSQRDIKTRRALARLELPMRPPLAKGSREALVRVRDQALIQVVGEDAGGPRFELFRPDTLPDGSIVPARGLAALPEPKLDDVFFDIEGDPFAFDDGLEYLFGVVDEAGYRQWWALEPAQEKTAFEGVVDYLVARRRANPQMHVYHYGAYERGRMARLSTRHATREEEVDELLRGGAFVDLYSVVRQSLRASVESYSIKRLEQFYGFERSVELHEANRSIVEFERYLEEGGSDETTLELIRAYNEDDCRSTSALRDWLEGRRLQAQAVFATVLPRPGLVAAAASEDVAAASAEVAALADSLTAGIAKTGPEGEEESARVLMANLLDWHRREAKSTWWRFFDLMARPDDELLEEREPIAGLEFVEEVERVGKQKNRRFRYRFPPQENRIEEGSGVHDPRLMAVTDLGAAGTVEVIDQVAGTLVMSRDVDLPHPTALVPLEFFRTNTHRQALIDIGRSLATHGLDTTPEFGAARDLLARRPPVLVTGRSSGPLVRYGEAGTAASLRLIGQLRGTTLAIQGPPGSGKSTVAARMVLELLAQNKKVGVTANSHKVISNLLDKIRAAGEARDANLHAIHRINRPGQGRETTMVKLSEDTGEVRAKLDSGAISVAAGSTWLWTNPKMREAVDVLFVDEAGQMSLANALAVSVGARSLVLLGDPQQLDQPTQGTHPGGAAVSALEHLLDGGQTIDPARGIFLEQTWRLHPDICEFTSDVFYEGKLRPREGLEAQRIQAIGELGGSGLRWLPVEHRGNTSRSDEEAEVVVALARRLAEGNLRWTNVVDDGAPVLRNLTWQDLLIVAPYNAQVSAIRERLPEAARDLVGTVDKFQGQQAAIVICSMTTSSPEDAPHGMEFLYSLNRLNVATSRAKCLAIVVGSPDLLRVRCHTPRQMRLANGLCRFIELAREMQPLQPHAPADGRPIQLPLGMN